MEVMQKSDFHQNVGEILIRISSSSKSKSILKQVQEPKGHGVTCIELFGSEKELRVELWEIHFRVEKTCEYKILENVHS